MKIYVEGGGDAKALRTACRRGFSEFIRRAGLEGKMPRIVACGSRSDAFDSFLTATRAGEACLLLVDSESEVSEESQHGAPGTWQPWLHLQRQDNWQPPPHTKDADCHLMTQCMESWLIADREALNQFFGQGFEPGQLPPDGTLIERVAKTQVYQALKQATRHCKTKAPYGKNENSFKLLALIEPQKVADASPWAKRFVTILQGRMEA